MVQGELLSNHRLASPSRVPLVTKKGSRHGEENGACGGGGSAASGAHERPMKVYCRRHVSAGSNAAAPSRSSTPGRWCADRRLQRNVIPPVERARRTDENVRRWLQRSMHVRPRTPRSTPNHVRRSRPPDRGPHPSARRCARACAESRSASADVITAVRRSTRVSPALRLDDPSSHLVACDRPGAGPTTDQPREEREYAPSV
jgi:hypothetical protein